MSRPVLQETRAGVRYLDTGRLARTGGVGWCGAAVPAEVVNELERCQGQLQERLEGALDHGGVALHSEAAVVEHVFDSSDSTRL
jgi:hypothetical protein